MPKKVKLTVAKLTGNKYCSRGSLAITETNQAYKRKLNCPPIDEGSASTVGATAHFSLSQPQVVAVGCYVSGAVVANFGLYSSMGVGQSIRYLFCS